MAFTFKNGEYSEEFNYIKRHSKSYDKDKERERKKIK